MKNAARLMAGLSVQNANAVSRLPMECANRVIFCRIVKIALQTHEAGSNVLIVIVTVTMMVAAGICIVGNANNAQRVPSSADFMKRLLIARKNTNAAERHISKSKAIY